jgi:proteasome activator subunit 4
MVKDGRRILPYKDELKDLLRLLLDKTYSKRGYQWASRLLYSILLACTNTYPLDDRFVNVDEWHSPGKYLFVLEVRYRLELKSYTGFLHSHHKRWGKMYPIGEVGVSRLAMTPSLIIHEPDPMACAQ